MNRKKIESTVRSQNLCSPVTRKNKPGAVKKILLSFALLGCVTGASAQEAAETAAPDISAAATPSTGDYFGGLTRPLTFDRMIPPYALEVTFNKTTHVIFPSAIRYVDLGSADLLAAKADGTENVLRVKAALRDFSRESNLSVITEDGAYYTFNVKYADEPVKLSVEMTDFLHDGEAVNRPNNALEIYMEELGSESPLLVKLIMRSIYKNDRREVKHIGCKRFGIQYLLKGIYSHNGLLYFHLQLKNSSNVPFEVDHLTFKIADKKVAKRTAIQEQVIRPLRAHNNVQVIRERAASARSSRFRSSPFPTTSTSWWNSTRKKADATRPLRSKMPIWCVPRSSTN